MYGPVPFGWTRNWNGRSSPAFVAVYIIKRADFIFTEHLSMDPAHEVGKADKIKLVIKFFIFCAVILVVWLMFMLPIIFYHLPQEVPKLI